MSICRLVIYSVRQIFTTEKINIYNHLLTLWLCCLQFVFSNKKASVSSQKQNPELLFYKMVLYFVWHRHVNWHFPGNSETINHGYSFQHKSFQLDLWKRQIFTSAFIAHVADMADQRYDFAQKETVFVYFSAVFCFLSAQYILHLERLALPDGTAEPLCRCAKRWTRLAAGQKGV